jgi:hypothetical protein
VSISNELQKAAATCDKAVYTKKDGHMVMSADEGKIVHLTMSSDTGKVNTVTGQTVMMWVDDEGYWRARVLKGATPATVVLPGGLGGLNTGDKKPPPGAPQK